MTYDRWHSDAHAATEIPAAITLEDCWKLVETSESTGRHFVAHDAKGARGARRNVRIGMPQALNPILSIQKAAPRCSA